MISKFSKADQNAFLFSVDLGIKNTVNLSSKKKPIFCDKHTGPAFGESIVFYVPADENKKVSFSVNDSYTNLPKAANGGCMYIDGDSHFQVSDVEVFKVIPN